MTSIEDHRASSQPQRINGKLPIAPGSYLQITSARQGPATLRPSVAALVASQAHKATRQSPARAVAASASAGPQVAGTGSLPAGFGRQVTWTGEDDLAMVAFINTADDHGLCVTGIRDGDTYEHVAVSGHASFSTETKNNGIAGLIGVVGVGADAAATYFGHPELTKFLDAATKYAQQQFPESEQPSKRRDGYGEDDSHNKARAEGGPLVCGPNARGIFYSAESDHFWIKPDGTRDDAHLPAHIRPGDAFFLQREMTSRTLHGTGDLFICAWDWNFPDNAGSYEVHFILRRGGRDTTAPTS
jgi:hypothetical protein